MIAIARSNRRPLVIVTCSLLGAVAVAWLAGLLWFLQLARAEIRPPGRVDGIVALTGGAGRVEAALRLLAAGSADRLLISGVSPLVEFPDLARRAGVGTELASRVKLGHAALSTRGNAAEAGAWAHKHRVASLIVVTSYYHMPRAMAELARELPTVSLYPVSVLPAAETPLLAGLRMMMGEYAKFLGAELGLSHLAGRADLAKQGSPG